MKYAIGEIILVVIGILIALAINNWNEARKNRVKEKDILFEIAETLEVNAKTLDSSIFWGNRFIKERQNYLKSVREKKPYNDTMQQGFQRMNLGFSRTALSKSGYEMLKISGFDLLQSKSLKKEILNLFEVTYPNLELRENDNRLNIILENVQLYYWQNFMDTDSGKFPINYEQLLNDNYFYELINAYLERETLLRNWKTETFDENNRVLQLINDELKN
ncbi:hypothetical protein JYB62_10240 [Algoriphagus lutimaris]|uniref:DUF6090 family protein n=1 Tax=Algoriphagus lutimaris TaxID=613197 RepID=UPI00196AAB07|nr:DUF6090 family protein [Algoriphagus lutimaris]MBN3520383.1 hypothetical protein [Algoriphagus lutimaris]